MTTTPKEAYDARQKLKRIARGDEPDAMNFCNIFHSAALRALAGKGE